MKKILLFLLVALVSCDKEDEFNAPSSNGTELNHAPLGFELEEPTSILNELCKGNLDNSIHSIFLVMYGNTHRKWEFEYLENSDIIDKMTFYLPHYQGCEQNVYQFEYNDSQNIKSVVSTRTNVCLDFVAVKNYTFNYNANGLLKSIFMRSPFTAQEYYIGYYPSGKVKEIWWDSRNLGQDGPIDFSVNKYFYDSDEKNIIRIEQEETDNIHIYRYEYDNKPNPYKGFFIAFGIFMPYVGPAYLSENNVISITEHRFSTRNNNQFTFPHEFEYSPTNTLIRYRDLDNERVFHVNQ